MRTIPIRLSEYAPSSSPPSSVSWRVPHGAPAELVRWSVTALLVVGACGPTGSTRTGPSAAFEWHCSCPTVNAATGTPARTFHYIACVERDTSAEARRVCSKKCGDPFTVSRRGSATCVVGEVRE